MAAVHETPFWDVDLSAQSLHEKGLNLATANQSSLTEAERAMSDQQRLDAAHRSFAVAVGHLGALPVTPDVQLQHARLIRDDGFTYGREALLQHDGGRRSDLFEQAHASLARSTVITEKLIVNELQAERRRGLYSEHGETLHLRRRLTVAHLAATDDLPRNRRSYLHRRDLVARVDEFAEAYEFLRHGSNEYYRAGYEVRSALFYRMLGYAGVGQWLQRAHSTLWRAERNRSPDRQDVRRLVLGGTAIAVQGRQAAARQVRSNP